MIKRISILIWVLFLSFQSGYSHIFASYMTKSRIRKYGTVRHRMLPVRKNSNKTSNVTNHYRKLNVHMQTSQIGNKKQLQERLTPIYMQLLKARQPKNEIRSENAFFRDDFNTKMQFKDKNLICTSAHSNHIGCAELFGTSFQTRHGKSKQNDIHKVTINSITSNGFSSNISPHDQPLKYVTTDLNDYQQTGATRGPKSIKLRFQKINRILKLTKDIHNRFFR